jgi:hypothetical protein
MSAFGGETCGQSLQVHLATFQQPVDIVKIPRLGAPDESAQLLGQNLLKGISGKPYIVRVIAIRCLQVRLV